MRFKFLLSLTALAAITLSYINTAAFAQSLVPNYYYDISVVRSDSSEDGDFSIRLASTTAMSGCFEATPADFEIMDAGAVIYVTLEEEADITMNQKPSYGHFECQMNTGNAFTDIPFNSKELLENETYKIEIKSENVGKLFDIELESDDTKLTFNSELKTPVRLPEDKKNKTHHYWYYPDNTIILSVHGMDKDPESMKKVKTFALSRGLTPMHEILDGFPVPKSGDKELFYVDSAKLFQNNITEDKPAIIGSISKAEEFLGPEGADEKMKKVSLFARRLSATD